MKIIVLISLMCLCLAKQCILPNNTQCPNMQQLKSCQTIISSPGINYTCPLELKLINEAFLRQGIYYNVTLFATRVQIGSININHQLVVTVSSKITILPQTLLRVQSKITIIHNYDKAMVFENVVIECSKFIIYSVSDIEFRNVNITTSSPACTTIEPIVKYPTEFMDIQYDDKKGWNASINIIQQNISQLQNLIRLSALSNIGVYSEKSIFIVSSKLLSSKINIASSNLNIDKNSQITTKGTACKVKQGIGQGIKFSSEKHCGSSGASASGYGSTDCIESTQYFSFILHSQTYGNKINPQVTGSAGAIVKNTIQTNIGSGGIIVIRVADQFILEGKISSSSQNSKLNTVNASAGSGGSVNILTTNFSGEGQVEAKGGKGIGSIGHGSGGWLKVSILGTNNFLGIINSSSEVLPLQTNKIRNPDSGNMILPKCKPGNQIAFNSLRCNSCNDTSFASILTSSCQKCPNQNIQSKSQEPKNRISKCFITNPNKSWKQKSPLQFLIHYSVYRIGILVSLLAFFVILGFLLFKNLKKKKNAIDSQGFDFNKVIGDLNENNVLTDKLKNQSMFKMGDLLYHVHRITVFGTNTPDNPWRISSKIPPHLNNLLISDSFQDFTKTFNSKAKWKLIQFILLYLSTLIYPLYWYFLVKMKKAKYKQISKLIESSMLNFIQPAYVHGSKVPKAKISKSSDYTLCYVDIFDYYQANLKYFKLDAPFLVHVSGEGNFIKPYYLCESDPFLNSLFMIVNRNISSRFIDDRFKIIDNLISHAERIQNSLKLTQFVRYFNRSSRSLDLGAPKIKFVQQIIKVINYLHEWNTNFFSSKKIKLSLVMMVTFFKRDRVKDNQISILENNDTEQFTKFMLLTLQNLSNSPLSDLKFSLFVYNPQANVSDLIADNQVEASPFSLNLIQNQQSNHQLIIKPKKSKLDINSRIIKICSRIRYVLISHKPQKLQKYTLRMLLSLLVLLNASIITVWQQDWFMVPYVFMNLVAPFLGVLWLASGISYGVGKAFIVVNILSIINNLIVLIECIILWNKSSYFYKLIRLVILIIGVSASQLGCQIMTSSKKLNQPKIS